MLFVFANNKAKDRIEIDEEEIAACFRGQRQVVMSESNDGDCSLPYIDYTVNGEARRTTHVTIDDRGRMLVGCRVEATASEGSGVLYWLAVTLSATLHDVEIGGDDVDASPATVAETLNRLMG